MPYVSLHLLTYDPSESLTLPRYVLRVHVVMVHATAAHHDIIMLKYIQIIYKL